MPAFWAFSWMLFFVITSDLVEIWTHSCASFGVLFRSFCSTLLTKGVLEGSLAPRGSLLDHFGPFWIPLGFQNGHIFIYIHIYLYIDIHIYHCFLCCDGISSSPSYPTHGGYTDVQRSDMRMGYESKHCFFMLLLAILAYASSINCKLLDFR